MQLEWLDYWWPLALIGIVGALMAFGSFGWVALRLLRVLRGVRRTTEKARAEPEIPKSAPRRVGLTRLAVAMGVGCLGLAISSLTFALVSQLYAYRALTTIELIGELRCERQLAPRRFRVSYATIDSGRRGEPIQVQLSGEQWLVGADILRWRPFMNYLGFRASYKVTRLEGRYVSAVDQRTESITAFDLAGGSDALWLALYRGKRVWPYSFLIDSVYGNAVYQFMEPGATFEIFIGRDGLIAKPKPEEENRSESGS